MLHESAKDGASAVAIYTAKKKAYKNTEKLCKDAGFAFVPMVVESHGGGWGAASAKILKGLATAAAEKEGHNSAQSIALLQQRLAVTLQRETARTVLRRLLPPERETRQAEPAVWQDVLTLSSISS